MTASLSPIEAAEGGAGVRLRVKVVPGGSRDAIAGVAGDRLRVKVAAPAEGGRANDAVLDLLAGTLGVSRRDVEVVAGRTHPRKTIRVRGVRPSQVRAALGLPEAP